jgi:flagellar biosynthesis protein FlhF
MAQRFFKFRADTLDDAYREMRTKLGQHALVVRTTQVKEGGVMGWFARTRVELTASAPDPAAPRPRSKVEQAYQTDPRSARPAQAPAGPPQQAPVGSQANVNDSVAYFQHVVQGAQERMGTNTPPPQPTAPQKSKPFSAQVLPFRKQGKKEQPANEAVLQDELREMRGMLEVLMAERPEGSGGVPSEFEPYYKHLIDRGVTRKAAASLMAAVARGADLAVLRDPRALQERLKLQMRRRLSTTGGIHLTPGTCRTVALVGATGVGKTTSLAKLAAHYAVQERAKVALLTADTYRVGAPDQLRVYANIIGLPLKVINDADEMREACSMLKDYDLVLVDTAGGSQYNAEQLRELRSLLVAAEPDEVHLVLAANTQLEDQKHVVSQFQCVGPTCLNFTKLDETQRYGTMYSLITESELPLGYLSVGQNVPDDLVLAKTGMMANLLMEGGAKRERSSA